MHPAKTKYSIISTRQKIANSAKQSLDLSVDGMQLIKVESERVLGVYVVVNFLSQVIFVSLLFLGMLMYVNEVETKEK